MEPSKKYEAHSMMLAKCIFSSDLLLPVQLRLEGLHERVLHLDRLIEVMGGLSGDIGASREQAAFSWGLNAIQCAFEGIVKSLCLLIDGSVPDNATNWYKNALDQLAGSGSGRMPVLPLDLVTWLKQVMVDPDLAPTIELKGNVTVLHQRWEAALAAVIALNDALKLLDARLADGTFRTGYAPDLEYVAQHAGRMQRAQDRELALRRALNSIDVAFRERGFLAVPFGSLVEGRVHGRSDLDLVVAGEVSHAAQRELWNIAEDMAAAKGVACDLHFPALYTDDFLDKIKVIVDGRIVPLRERIVLTGALGISDN